MCKQLSGNLATVNSREKTELLVREVLNSKDVALFDPICMDWSDITELTAYHRSQEVQVAEWCR